MGLSINLLSVAVLLAAVMANVDCIASDVREEGRVEDGKGKGKGKSLGNEKNEVLLDGITGSFKHSRFRDFQ